MNITNVQYVYEYGSNTEHSHILATIDGETMSVPLDLTNRHYDEIMRQVSEGTLTIADAE